MDDIGLTILRIDADAVDDRRGANRRRIQRAVPGMTAARYDRLLAALPAGRLRTRVRTAQDQWPSLGEYMEAMGDHPDDRAFLRSLPADGWLDRASAWRDAERRDAARETALFAWHRPLVRLGALVLVDGVLSVQEEAAMAGAIPRAAWFEDCGLLIAGLPQNVGERLAAALGRRWMGPTRGRAGMEAVSKGKKT